MRRRKETITFPKQKRLLHFALGRDKIQGTFEVSIFAFWVSTIVCQQDNYLHTGFPRCHVQGGV